jgi:hypothetical protein
MNIESTYVDVVARLANVSLQLFRQDSRELIMSSSALMGTSLLITSVTMKAPL